MFFIEKPYISSFFKETIAKAAIPVVDTPIVSEFSLVDGTVRISEERASQALLAGTARPYSTSENAIAWLEEHASGCKALEAIHTFKDKARFRRTVSSLYPDFFFLEVAAAKLHEIDYNSLPASFIIKPNVGFFSMGVYPVDSYEAWQKALINLEKEMKAVAGIYPEHVLGNTSFIIEECIEGDEFAIDAYFDEAGKATVVGIHQHQFAGPEDVSDRVYYTSKEVIEDHLEEFTILTDQIGKLCNISQNFPIHMEVRKRADGLIIPIEVNPMRFGGWCTTADNTAMAYGFNPYLMYYYGEAPDWNEALKGRDGKRYNMLVLDNSTGVATENIASFDYEGMLAGFSTPLHHREINWNEYPVFGFVFAETDQSTRHEVERLLSSTLSEFITCK